MSAPANLVYTQSTGAPPVSADNLNTFTQWQINVAGMRAFTGLPNMTIYMQGTTAPNDGGQGFFYWNTTTGTDDNGVTTIVPTGSTAGCWSRITTLLNANSVTNAQLVQAPANTIKGNPTNITANEEDMTVGQTLSLLQLTPLTPQGRLSLSSTAPVMASAVINNTTIYYLPYAGQLIPISDGTRYLLASIGASGLTMTLNTSAHLSGNNYDLFVFFNAGVVTIGAGPAWASGTSRGTGPNTTQISQQNGLWANTNAINLTNGVTTYSSINIGQATYIGSFYATANGQTGMNFNPAAASGGGAPILGLYNAYNRVRVIGHSYDSTASWAYTSTAYRSANNSTANSISWIDGTQQSIVEGMYNCAMSCSSTNITGKIGIAFNGTGSPNTLAAEGTSVTIESLTAFDQTLPLLGFNYAQAVEAAAATVTFTAGSTYQGLKISLEM